MTMKTPNSELRRLTDAWHDGTITPEDGMRLERRLLAEPDARAFFFEISGIESSLAEAAARLPFAEPTVRFEPRSQWWRMAAVFVVGLFSGALLLKYQPFQAARLVSQPKPPSATVTGMLGVKWDGASVEHSVTLAAGSTESRIGTGLLELTFASGTRAVIEGPAAFQVLGDNAMRLTRGKLVADVPKGAEGFSVTYQDGKIVDLGTEFGVEVAYGGRSANVGVFRGEIEFHRHGDVGPPFRLLENHAILSENDIILSVPFKQEKFTRKLPSREFAWELHGAHPGPVVCDYDISHLVWNAGRYRIICKWMKGPDRININGAEFLCDGNPVASDQHAGVTGRINITRDNCFDLIIPAGAYHRGRWTLRLRISTVQLPGVMVDSAGVVLVEDGSSLDSKPADYIGTWEYLHDGRVFRRSFLADGTARLTVDGQPFEPFATSHWRIENGSLVLDVDDGTGQWGLERHLLRDSNTLVFTNLPYRDATRANP